MNSSLRLPVSRNSVSLRSKVVDCLKEAILFGELLPGQKLVERDLCTRLKISRPLLREALQQLQAEGLIAHVLHKGPSVATLSAEEVRNIYEVRRVLEQLAGERFAQHAGTTQIKALRESLSAMRALHAKKNIKGLLREKNHFYDLLAAGAANPVMGQLMILLRNRVALLRHYTLSSPGRALQSLKEQAAIVSAIEAGKGKLAGRHCAVHIDAASRIALSGVARVDGSQPTPRAPRKVSTKRRARKA